MSATLNLKVRVTGSLLQAVKDEHRAVCRLLLEAKSWRPPGEPSLGKGFSSLDMAYLEVAEKAQNVTRLMEEERVEIYTPESLIASRALDLVKAVERNNAHGLIRRPGSPETDETNAYRKLYEEMMGRGLLSKHW